MSSVLTYLEGRDDIPEPTLSSLRALASREQAALDAALAREERLREAAQAHIDELDAPPGHPLSDHYASQAEARLRAALAETPEAGT